MKILISLTVALIIVAISTSRNATAFQASDCAPASITPYPDTLLDADGNPTGWTILWMQLPNEVYGGSITCKNSISWTCPEGAGTTCTPCWKAYLYKNFNYQYPGMAPLWITLNKPQSYFQMMPPPDGLCGVGGTGDYTMTCNGLDPGQYKLVIEFGAGDDRRCYILRTSWLIFSL